MTQDPRARESFGVFGTTGVLLVTSPEQMHRARAITDELLAEVDRAASRFRADSELSALNGAGGRPVVISQTLTDLLRAALRAAELTAGAVDPTCAAALRALGYDRDFGELQAAGAAAPSAAAEPAAGWRNVHLDAARRRVWLTAGARLDLGATAKAWAADRCAELIAAKLGCGALVSLGGDVAIGGPAPEQGWQVRVTDDHAAPQTAPGQTVTIWGGGLATSSTTVRTWTAGGRAVHHIIDPATGEPASSCWRTVSVAAGTCTDANTASTAAIVRGPAAPDWLAGLGLPARLVATDGSVQTTAGWPAAEDGAPH